MQERKNILWISHFVPYPPKGGSLLRSYNLLKEISKYHDVTLVSFVQGSLLETMFASKTEGLDEAENHLAEFCENVHFLDIPSESTRYGNYFLAFKSIFTKDPYSINWLKSKKMLEKLRDVFDGKKFDVVHFDTISLAPYLKLFSNVSTVLNHHNIESHMMSRRAEKESFWLKKLYYMIEGKKLLRYEKRYCRHFDLNITCSHLDSVRLRNIDSSLNVEEVTNGVDISYFVPKNIEQYDYSLIFVGGLNWYPNRSAMDFFVGNVYPLLRGKFKNLRLDIVGQAPPEEYFSMAEDDPHLFVHGFVDDVRPYISAAAVYICPITDGGGTKLKILDALAMGKALVAHPVACEGIDVEEFENVMFAESPEEFVDKIALLFSDSGLRSKLGTNGRKLICDKYSYESIGRKLAGLYENVSSKD